MYSNSNIHFQTEMDRHRKTLTPALVESITSGMTCASVRCMAQKPAGQLQLCSACSAIAYCGASCQREGWGVHSTVCTKMNGASWGQKVTLVTAMFHLAMEENETQTAMS
jgi:hypothetical protein